MMTIQQKVKKYKEKLLWQKRLSNIKGTAVCELVSDEEFELLFRGNGYDNWDDNYYCIIEQDIAQSRETDLCELCNKGEAKMFSYLVNKKGGMKANSLKVICHDCYKIRGTAECHTKKI